MSEDEEFIPRSTMDQASYHFFKGLAERNQGEETLKRWVEEGFINKYEYEILRDKNEDEDEENCWYYYE